MTTKRWIVEIENDALIVDAPADLRDAILDGYGYPLAIGENPGLVRVLPFPADQQSTEKP